MGSLAALRASRTRDLTSSGRFRMVRRDQVTSDRTLKVRMPKCSLTARLILNKSVRDADGRLPSGRPLTTKHPKRTQTVSPATPSMKTTGSQEREAQSYATSAKKVMTKRTTKWRWPPTVLTATM